MTVIKDKQVELCICGRSKKTELRLAKRRVLSWFGVIIILGTLLTVITYPELIVESFDYKTVVVLGILVYYFVGIPYKTISYINRKHKFICALRHALLDVV